MSIEIKEKLKLIRESERLKKKEVAEMTGINYVTYVGYENGKSSISHDAVVRLLKHPRFRKYRDWFMFDEIDPASGQIAPALAHFGQDETTSQHSDKKIG
ncbi:XRE family transcriptional regulator [Enterobacter hormaechei subsp. xiangfangensis]|uniref:helix-turn-helix transcriptional regulator n=1 Tax=Enterobacter hormaechei TaxID=158836 RepID=UPI000736C181|nr:helix-turn-helix transcriptional regulator [Enterobacter hormaechei]KTQ62203.1 XRE family transcriptional regulator [Enterobacter hormaechei]KTQ63433.1 XRE family transcriptional regulator [Enterobacter hormaechei subsp. xiangfangensis]KTQ66538.1 XRE family transcriptional regulator [Enterobacter hormaechei]KTQ71004.1 XRE family transcriptional regulator [Enterobacter hormaechei subsp. xiangfangensis]KTQ81392.1 XRE family transcriptional regulator [Enterobacter hormaechei]